MILAAACALTVLAVAGCAIYAALTLEHGHRPGCLPRTLAARATRALLRVLIAVLSVSPVRAAVVRARWAWRCRKPAGRSDGDPLDEWERWELITILRGWGKTARPERSRT